jgi:hypothetical protein
MFLLNVNSVLDVTSRLVSITATAATLLFSARLDCTAIDLDCIAISQLSGWPCAVQFEEKGPYCRAAQ